MTRQKENFVRNAAEFESYLKKRKPVKVKTDNNEVLNIRHREAADIITKMIQVVPMDSWIKKVMTMRVGNPLVRGKAMSHLQIAIALGCTEDEVREMERYGMTMIQEWFKRISTPEVIGKFNSMRVLENAVNAVKTELANPQHEAAKGVSHGSD